MTGRYSNTGVRVTARLLCTYHFISLHSTFLGLLIIYVAMARTKTVRIPKAQEHTTPTFVALPTEVQSIIAGFVSASYPCLWNHGRWHVSSMEY